MSMAGEKSIITCQLIIIIILRKEEGESFPSVKQKS